MDGKACEILKNPFSHEIGFLINTYRVGGAGTRRTCASSSVRRNTCRTHASEAMVSLGLDGLGSSHKTDTWGESCGEEGIRNFGQ